jgi:exosortase
MAPTAVAAGGVLLVLIAVVYRSVWPEWASDLWNEPDYSHGLLVPFVSAWLVYRRRRELAAASPQPALGGIVLMVAGIGALALGLLSAEFFLTRLSVVVVLAGLVAAVLGYRHLRLLAMPLAFLVFAVPLPALVFNSVAFPLQILASKIAIAMLHAVEVPALREGNIILLPNGALEVAEACSGLRSLVSLAATSVVLAALLVRHTSLRLALVGLSIPVAVWTNALRVSGTGVLAYHYGPTVAEGFFHGFSGWMVFLVAVAVLASAAEVVHRLERA